MDASIIKHLRANGEQLDADISKALNIPMAQLHAIVEKLAASGDVICCKVDAFYRWQEDRGDKLPSFLRPAGAHAWA